MCVKSSTFASKAASEGVSKKPGQRIEKDERNTWTIRQGMRKEGVERSGGSGTGLILLSGESSHCKWKSLRHIVATVMSLALGVVPPTLL